MLRYNLRELIVNIVSKARGIDNGQGNADTVLFKLCGIRVLMGGRTAVAPQLLTNGNRLDTDTLLDMSSLWVVRRFVGKDLRFAKGVHESGSTRPRRAFGDVSAGYC